MLLDRRQHYSNNLISWRMPSERQSCYTASYQGVPGEDMSKLRRFPRQHAEGKPGSAPLATTTTEWFREPDIPHKTPLHVLAISQQPFLRPNKWAYSYRPIWSWIRNDFSIILPRIKIDIQFPTSFSFLKNNFPSQIFLLFSFNLHPHNG